MIENPNVICNDCGFGKQNKELKESFDLIKSSLYSMTKVWNSTREDCRILAQKLLQVKPELREWLEVNFKEYL
jgi:hypothetical protein